MIVGPYRLAVALGLALAAMGADAPPPAPAATATATASPFAGKRQIAIDDIFSSTPIGGRLPSAISWSPDGSRFLYVVPDPAGAPVDTHLYDVATHRDRIFVHAALNGKGARPFPEFVWAPNGRTLAYLDGGSLWTIGTDGSGRRKLADDADDPQWSPNGRRIAYVHASDLYVVDSDGGAAQRLTADGTPDISNGDPDWVNSEELGIRHAFHWSPDSRRIAYLQYDQRPVVPFPIVDFLLPDNAVTMQRYPLAGAKNSIVSLRVVDTVTPAPAPAPKPPRAARRKRDGRAVAVRPAHSAPAGPRVPPATMLYTTARLDDYIASVGWTPQGEPTAEILDRPQRIYRYLAFDAHGSPRVLVRDADPHAIDISASALPRWLPDGRRFLYESTRDGIRSLELIDARSGVRTRLTHGVAVLAGSFDDRREIEFDQRGATALVPAAYPTRRDRSVLAVPVGGGAFHALSEDPGAHVYAFSPDGRRFVRTDSRFATPPVMTIGSTVSDSETPFAAAPGLTGYALGRVELGEIDSPWGKLDDYLILPPDFNPANKYPVITYVYGGPAAPTTTDEWNGDDYLYHQALAERGFIVFSVDGPGSQVDSQAHVALLERNLGPMSLAGQLAGAAYLRSLPYVDPKRLGIWGWSFGGTETTYAMTHAPGTWKVGVAVAPVTDWQYYDSIYTERYMGTPLHDAAAYARSSVIDKADGLQGALLISHGTSDDNVHLANTISLLQAFVLAGKQVDFMVYPRKTHGISGIPQRRHLFTHMLDYWQSHL